MGQGDEWQHGAQAESSALDALRLGDFVRWGLHTDHLDANQEKRARTESCQEPESCGKNNAVSCEERQDIGDEGDGDGDEEAFVGTDPVKDQSRWQLDKAVCPKQSAEKEGQSRVTDPEKRHELGAERGNAHKEIT